MEQPLQKIQSKHLVNDYIGWRLAKSGYHQWHIINKIDLNQNNKKSLFIMMRQMCYEFEKRYNKDYSSLIDQLQLTTQANCKDVFLSIVIELFEIKAFCCPTTQQKCIVSSNYSDYLNQSNFDSNIHLSDNLKILEFTQLDCNWGRIIGLFAFAGCLSIKCYEKKLPNLVYDIINWLTQFLSDDEYRISNWIESKGNWNGFLEYFKNYTNISELSSTDVEVCPPHSSQLSLNASSMNQNLTDNFSLATSARNLFCNLSQAAGLTFTSFGVLTLGLIYIKRNGLI